jgi:hypothetical protein
LRLCRKESETHEQNARFLGNVFALATDEKKPIKRQLTPQQVKDCMEKAKRS